MTPTGLLAGRVALVTGAGSGLGRAIAQAMREQGALLAVNDCADDRADETVRLLDCADAAVAVPGDVTVAADVDRMVAGCVAALGGLDVLVNNAGIAPAGMVKTHAEDDWANAFAVNLESAVFVTQAALPHLRRTGAGRVINMSSQIAEHGMMYQAAYAASKAGVSALTKSLARVCGPSGVTVNAICPGAFPETAMVQRFMADWPEYVPMIEFYDRMRSVPNAGRARDVGDVAVFLASDWSRFVNGQLITVNGGFS